MISTFGLELTPFKMIGVLFVSFPSFEDVALSLVLELLVFSLDSESETLASIEFSDSNNSATNLYSPSCQSLPNGISAFLVRLKFSSYCYYN